MDIIVQITAMRGADRGRMRGAERCAPALAGCGGWAILTHVVDPGPWYIQIVGLGLPWTLVHCGGMCGPLVAAFRFGHGAADGRIRRASAELIAYQAGRAAGLALLGAAAGWAGAVAAWRIGQWLPWATLVLGAAFLAIAAAELGLVPARWATAAAGPPRRLVGLAGRVGRPLLRAGLLGLILSALPCGVVLWALGLAAAGAHPGHGAAMLAILVGLTTPVLWLAAAGAAVLPAGRWPRLARWLPAIAWSFSGAWLISQAAVRLLAPAPAC